MDELSPAQQRVVLSLIAAGKDEAERKRVQDERDKAEDAAGKGQP